MNGYQRAKRYEQCIVCGVPNDEYGHKYGKRCHGCYKQYLRDYYQARKHGRKTTDGRLADSFTINGIRIF